MKELLKYQEIDAQIRKLKDKMLLNENRKKATEMQNYLKDVQNKLVDLDGNAGAVEKQIDSIKKEYDKLYDQVNNLDETNEEAADLTNLVIEKISRLERDLSGLQQKLIKINNDFENLMKNARTAKTNLVYYKQEYEKVKVSVEPEIEKLITELNEQKKKVKPEVLAKYMSKAEGKVFPIFVPLANGHCAGCRMEIPAGKIKDFDSHGFIECENCGRYVFKAE
ncbi:MAG: hypothetical protein K6F08_02675 [bacterium]|nr:hypothetical protein [bacterium]